MKSYAVRVIMFALTDVASYLACYKSIVLKQKPESLMATDTKDAPKHLFFRIKLAHTYHGIYTPKPHRSLSKARRSAPLPSTSEM